MTQRTDLKGRVLAAVRSLGGKGTARDIIEAAAKGQDGTPFACALGQLIDEGALARSWDVDMRVLFTLPGRGTRTQYDPALGCKVVVG